MVAQRTRVGADRCISEAVGADSWKVIAANRALWNSFLPQWMRVISIPWTGGGQDSLMNV